MKRFQITKMFDWFSQREIFDIIRNMKEGDRVEIIKLPDTLSEVRDNDES